MEEMDFFLLPFLTPWVPGFPQTAFTWEDVNITKLVQTDLPTEHNVPTSPAAPGSFFVQK